MMHNNNVDEFKKLKTKKLKTVFVYRVNKLTIVNAVIVKEAHTCSYVHGHGHINVYVQQLSHFSI